MLVLSRKCGESLIINNQVEIKVIEISGDKIKIGIEAPQDFKILRKELCQTVEVNKQAAAKAVTKELLSFMAELEK